MIEDKKPKSKKGNNSDKMYFELSPLIVLISLWMVITYSEFQVNIFSNNRAIIIYHMFLHDNDEAKVISMLQASFENSWAKNDSDSSQM